MRPGKKPLILAGDIGGTKTNLGLFDEGKRRPLLKVRKTYASRNARSLEEILDRFVTEYPNPIRTACFGIAGPVEQGCTKTTNLPWTVASTSIKKRFGWQTVRLVNDLVATALAIPLLTGRETVLLKEGNRRLGDNLGLVAPGTGLGMALLVGTKDGPIPLASEGGHADFGPNNTQEIALWRYLKSRFGHVSPERVLSGPGLDNIYLWLKDSRRYREPAWLNQRRLEIEPARAITEAALEKRTPLAVAALKTFVSILGSVSGNLALTAMATGGIYLGGGIVPKILPFLKEPYFTEAFMNKGRFRPFLKKISVQVILNDRAALLGAAHHAVRTVF